jgi:hypothetical protein
MGRSRQIFRQNGGVKPVVLTIDVEPTNRTSDIEEEWLGFGETVAAFDDLRRRLRPRTGRTVSFAWFVRADPQIEGLHGDAAWGLRRHCATLERLLEQGDELGLHVHAFRWVAENRMWITDHANADWVEHAVAVGVRAFREARGQAPRSFRFGDRFLSNRVVAQLAALGVAVDVTVEAGAPPVFQIKQDEIATGELPDYRKVARRPYRPSRRDFRRPAFLLPRRLTLLPVSTGCINAKPVVPPRVEDDHAMVHLNLALDPGWIRGIWDAVVETDAVVVSVLRTGDLVEPRSLENLQVNLEHLASHAAVPELSFENPDHAVRSFVA